MGFTHLTELLLGDQKNRGEERRPEERRGEGEETRGPFGKEREEEAKFYFPESTEFPKSKHLVAEM